MDADMWRPPTNRLMRTLDRSFFKKTVNLKAARVHENTNISKCRKLLIQNQDTLNRDRIDSVFSDPDPERARLGKKCIALRPEFHDPPTSVGSINSPSDRNGETYTPWPYSSTVNELVQEGLISVIPYQMHLDYSYWTYHDIISAILPEDDQGEIPSGFTNIGHVAHLNLRDEYLRYKHIIAEILMDKNPTVKTVINKVDDVGEESEYRTFNYEVLAGQDDLNVRVIEEDCVFRFDYSKVYWNSRLNTEHRRLVSKFKEGEAVCDVMAGVGPFAVPAGKKRIFVWANDLNPDSYVALQDSIRRNKVSEFVTAFEADGRAFIRDAMLEIAQVNKLVTVKTKPPSGTMPPGAREIRFLQQPRSFQHFVMNLPATALTFLPSFIGAYTPELRKKLGDSLEMPLIHAYCFSTKSETNIEEGIKICKEISQHLQYEMKPGNIEDGDVEVYDVRDVAPKKRMFCASFRLPEEVAFRPV